MLAFLEGNFPWNFMLEITLLLVTVSIQSSHALVSCAPGSSDTNTESLTARMGLP